MQLRVHQEPKQGQVPDAAAELLMSMLSVCAVVSEDTSIPEEIELYL